MLTCESTYPILLTMNNANRTEVLNVNRPCTLVTQGGLGGAYNKHKCRSLKIEVGPYAQHARAYFVTFLLKGKRNARCIVLGYDPRGFVLEGHDVPELAGTMGPARETESGLIVSHSRGLSHDPMWDAEARAAMANAPGLLFDIEADKKANSI